MGVRLGFFAEAEEAGGRFLKDLGGLAALTGGREGLSLVLTGQHHWRPDEIDCMTVVDFVRALARTDAYNKAMAEAMKGAGE